MARHPHLIVPTVAAAVRFTSPSTGPRERMDLPVRGRAELYAQSLLGKLEAISPQATARVDEQKALGLDDGLGIYLAFESEPNFPLKYESMDLAKSGIELCIVKTLADNRMQATVFVPDGKLDIFLKKIAAYRDENTVPRREGGATRPKNQDLVESISDIKIAALEALWTEEELPFPDRDAVIALGGLASTSARYQSPCAPARLRRTLRLDSRRAISRIHRPHGRIGTRNRKRSFPFNRCSRHDCRNTFAQVDGDLFRRHDSD